MAQGKIERTGGQVPREVAEGRWDGLVEVVHNGVRASYGGGIVETEDRENTLAPVLHEGLDLRFCHCCHGLLSLRMSLDEAAEEDARHEIGQPGGIDRAGRVIPVVDPVHHPEEDVAPSPAVAPTLLLPPPLVHPLAPIDTHPL